jgi:hypothetical protein
MSQRDAILAHLKAGNTITAIEALRRWGCFRLAARIEELRDAGYPIETTLLVDGERRFARYWMKGEK